jgi:iron complex outermembrane receptor protein
LPDPNSSTARRSRFALLLAGALSLALVWPASSRAQPATAQPSDAATDAEKAAETAPSGPPAAPPSDVEVIRVKGRAVTGIETEVPASVTQFSAADLQALGTQNVSDLAKVTPNVEIKTTGSTAPTFFIRGVGLADFSANASGAVAIYRDDVAINAPAIQLTPLFDLENVEVLRGPQSYGSGRNASAGAIKVYSRKPTGDLSAELRSSFGNFDFKDFEGAIEAPIVDELLATRLAFRWTGRGPIGTNRCAGKVDAPGIKVCGEGANTDPIHLVPGGLPADVNDLGNWAARGQLRFQPQQLDMDWILNFHGAKVDQLSTLGQAMGVRTTLTTPNALSLGGATSGPYIEPDNAAELLGLEGPSPSGARTIQATRQLAKNLALRLDQQPFTGDYNRVGKTTLDNWGAALRGEWSLGPVTLTSISGYEKYDRFRDTDQDFTPDVLFESIAEDDAWEYFQELKAAGELAETPFRWELGGYYLLERLTWHDNSLFAKGITQIERDYTQDLDSYAVYASFAWDFLDDFTLEGGVRWNWDKRIFDFTTVQNALGAPADPTTSTNELIGSAPTGGLTLTYHFGEGVSSYWKYSRGWKPGTFNSIAATCSTSVANDCNVTLAEPETIDAFETGLRGSWLDGRLQLGAALFYYMYDNYQVFVVADVFGAPPTFSIINANDAELYGAELDLRLEPLADLVPPELEGLVISARGGWLESQYLDFTTSVTRFGSGRKIDVQQDFTGHQLINSPRFKVSASAEWTLDLGDWGAVIPRYDFSWSSDIFFDPNEGRGSADEAGQTFLPEYGTGQRRYWLHNVRLAYRVPDANIEIAGWARNVTDKVYKTYAFDATTFANVVINFVGEPRTYGLDLTVRF